ncbi:MAG: primase alpha helix C-terminal domain-containing protein, partial [Pseudomonadota bacterium]|nr:primase alpha helix C-terminal domain-containing protein [Pseudomonadota bacterium]
VVNGAQYEIAKNLPIARAPESLLERILAKRNRPRPTLDAQGHMIIAAGQRNATLFALACLLRRFGLEFNAILESLRAANADHCDPQIEDEELRQIAASAMRYAPRSGRRETK